MTNDDDLPDPLTPAEIAALERVDPKSVAAWCKLGKLKAYKIGRLWRIRKADYLAFRKSPAPLPEPFVPTAERPPKVGGPSRQRAADDYLDRIYCEGKYAHLKGRRRKKG